MDPLTHSLFGLALAATRPATRGREAACVGLVAANLPDIDILVSVAGPAAAIGLRRGGSHGVPGLVVEAGLLILGLVAWRRWRKRQPPRHPPPLAPPALRDLALLAGLALASHPLLDWVNDFGMRWWEPWPSRWTQGDAWFIVEPWVLLALGLPWLLTLRRRPALLASLAAAGALLLLAVARAAPAQLPAALLIPALAGLALALPRPDPARRRRWARGVIVALILYATGMALLSRQVVRAVGASLAAAGTPPRELAATPVPVASWQRRLIADHGDHYRLGTWNPLARPAVSWDRERLPAARTDPVWPALRAAIPVAGYRTWLRFPWITPLDGSGGRAWRIHDARYAERPGDGALGVVVALPEATVSP